jgi:hypothetical protein
MKKVVEQKQVVVAQAKTDCDELLVQIVQDKRVADEQEKQVGARLFCQQPPACLSSCLQCQCCPYHKHGLVPSNHAAASCHLRCQLHVLTCRCLQPQVNAQATKIAKETEEANIIANQVSAELEKALPALQEAEAALNVLTKKDISELKVRSGAACALLDQLTGPAD